MKNTTRYYGYVPESTIIQTSNNKEREGQQKKIRRDGNSLFKMKEKTEAQWKDDNSLF